MKFKTIGEVWNAVNSGKTVCWGNDGYEVLKQSDPSTNEDYLRVTFTSNWFGSKLEESELDALYIKGGT